MTFELLFHYHQPTIGRIFPFLISSHSPCSGNVGRNDESNRNNICIPSECESIEGKKWNRKDIVDLFMSQRLRIRIL